VLFVRYFFLEAESYLRLVKSKHIVLATFLFVIILSPLVPLFGTILGFGFSAWLNLWLKYVFLFIVAALISSFIGLGIALDIAIKEKTSSKDPKPKEDRK
jgi:hypothetical protein